MRTISLSTYLKTPRITFLKNITIFKNKFLKYIKLENEFSTVWVGGCGALSTLSMIFGRLGIPLIRSERP